jgi:sec-independent protein translocase protein TatB
VLNFSPEKLFLVGVIALMVLGPNRLPQAARQLGRWVAALRRMSHGFQEEVRSALGEPTDAVTSAVAEFRAQDLRRSMREGVRSTLTGEASPSSRESAGPAAAGPGPGDGTARTPDDPTLN